MGFINNFEAKLKRISDGKKRALEVVGKFVSGGYINGLAEGGHIITGNLVGSVTHKVEKDIAVRIGSPVEYAAFVEFRFPVLRSFLDNNQKEMQDLFKLEIGAKL